MNQKIRLLRQNPPVVDQASQAPVGDEIDIRATMSVIWRGRLLVVFFALIAAAMGACYARFVATPMFTSTSKVILEIEQRSLLGLDSLVAGLTGETAEVNSELEVLASRELIAEVVEELDLINNPEFNETLREQTQLEIYLEPYYDLAIRLINGTVLSDWLELTRTDPELAQRVVHDSVVTETSMALSFTNVSDSLVFEIEAESEDPVMSARLADAVAQQYVQNQLKVKFETSEQATTWLTERVATIKVQLEEAEQRLAEVNSSNELLSAESLSGQEIQLKELRQRITDAEERQMRLEAQYAALNAASTSKDRAQIANDAQLTSMLQTVGTSALADDRFEQRYRAILEELTQQQDRLARNVMSLQASEEELAHRIERQSADLIELQQYRREAESLSHLYEYFLTRLNETVAQQGIQQADSRVLSEAVLPIEQSSPRTATILALSFVAGLTLGIAIVLIREIRRNVGFRTGKDLHSATGHTVMAQIPQIRGRRQEIFRYITNNPTSGAAEAIRNLRTSVMLSDADQTPRVIMPTSSVPGEGKTTISLALSHNLTELGKEVLLIEGDIRRRTFSEYFSNIPRQGLAAVITGDATLEEVTFREEGFGPDIIAGDESGLNAADLFATDRFRKLIAQLRSKYDVVVIDTPPILVVPDARIIAPVADMVLFTVRWDHTTRVQVDEALRAFYDSDQTVDGMVLSRIDSNKMRHYGYGEQHGLYGKYGNKYYGT